MKEEKKLYLLTALLSFMLLAFTRVESLAFLVIIAIILLVKYKNVKAITKNALSYRYVPIILIPILIYLISLKINLAFYITFVKGFIHSFSLNNEAAPISNWGGGFIYFIKVLGAYGLLEFVVLSILSFIYLIKKKKYLLLVPFFITLPAFIYLINPSISSDHPWMLRRFVFAVVPIAILYSVIFLEKIIRKKSYLYAVLILLTFLNLSVSLPFLRVTENKDLLPQIDEISHNFGREDLILLDREATGDGWVMMNSPLSALYGKQAVYFINPDDITKIDLAKFNQVYFIIPDKNIDFYKKNPLFSRLIPQEDYTLRTNHLAILSGKKSQLINTSIIWPPEQETVVYGKIYLLRK